MAQTVKHRNTKQRQVIKEELMKLKSHPTAAELYEIVRKRIPNVSMGTVYRNLEFLAESGEINKLKLSGEQARFDADTTRHLHVRCDECGRLDDFDYKPEDPVSDCPEELRGYKILGCRMEFHGICPDCLKNETGDTQTKGETDGQTPIE